MARLQEIYRDKIAPELAKQFGYTSPMQVPRLTKITLNMGVSEAVSDKKVMDNAVADLTKIAGQKPVVTKAKKAIAGFKIREDLEIGARTTLHGKQMWNFLDRLFMIALPRVRDFQGVTQTSVDHSGNLNLGLKDHTIFSEIVPEKVQHIFSFQVTVVTTARNSDEGRALFRHLGVPFQQSDTNDK